MPVGKKFAYYNEFDKRKAAWLRELIKRKLIALGEVDERSIKTVSSDDVKGFKQCHWFAGIGIWSYVLKQAGWPEDKEVWTGSCPCQSFSTAGMHKGFADERHLWPDWFRIISKSKPCVIFGEQVAGKDALVWIDLVQTDLESKMYAFASLDLCAAGFGAPHIRQRFYFVADSFNQGLERTTGKILQAQEKKSGSTSGHRFSDVANSHSTRLEGRTGKQKDQTKQSLGKRSMVNAVDHQQRTGPVNGFWRDADWILCTDGKWRAVRPGTQPLAVRTPARVVRIGGYGDGIVSEVAKNFIEAYIEVKRH
jgi:DNA (cytosine-5)-methyltransferase 1